MTDETTTRKLAAGIVTEHGTGAARVARKKLAHAVAAADDEQAAVWRSVCALLARVGDGEAKAEPGLDEVLRGGVTRAVMRADGADETEIRDLAERQAKRRRDDD
jgi:hypothetical protein